MHHLYIVFGRKSRKAIEEARSRVSKAINTKSKEIYFTSCGSESDNLALKGIAYANKDKGKHIITSKIEHPAVLDSCKQFKVEAIQDSILARYYNKFERTFLNELGFTQKELKMMKMRFTSVFTLRSRLVLPVCVEL